MGSCIKIKMPTAVVLLGATGDLAQKKLLSAFMDLFVKGLLPDHFYLIAFSKDEHTNESYRDFARKYLAKNGKQYDQSLIDSFLDSIEYVQGLFDDRDAFARIKEKLEHYDESIGTCSSKLFYLAVPPIFYDNIFEQIASVNLEQPCVVGEGWTRILVEKPFGSDLDNAKYLEDKMSKLFREEQIYRIDHYLAKDALQNILAFRFSNVLFEDKWNKDFVEAVYIKTFENFGVESRGSFFDGVGALRDVGQNHMLQMLALVAMENPEKLEANALRAKRAKVLQALRTPENDEIDTTVIKGQYEGYQDIENIASQSKTETYFAIKTYLDTPRWEGVPFYLEHGKATSESSTEITVRFRSSKNCVCGNSEPHDHPNLVKFSISPEQKITVRFWVRKPGLKYELEPNDLVFDRTHTTKDAHINIADAYEEVLYDALCGDQTLFVSNAEQEAAWKYVTAILTLWVDTEPKTYEQGSGGPESNLQDEIQKTIRLFS